MSFDSGVLVGLDRNDARAWAWFRRAVERGEPPLVCTPAIVEAWRDRRRQAQLAKALRAFDIDDVDQPLARTAGEALASVSGAGAVDAMIAASAARAGALLVTDDLGDMRTLADGHFRALRVAALRH